jgi:hypothetical protein
MKPRGSLPFSKNVVTGHNPGSSLIQSACSQPVCLRSFQLPLGFPNGSSLQVFRLKFYMNFPSTLYILHTLSALSSSIIVTVTISGEEYKLWSSSLCKFFYILLLPFLGPYTVKPVLNWPFIKRNFVLNRNIFRSRYYHSIPWLNGNLASAEKCSGPLRFRLKQVLLYSPRDSLFKHLQSIRVGPYKTRKIIARYILNFRLIDRR